MGKKDVWTISSFYFKSKNIQSARLDAEVLLSHVLRQERIYLYVHFDEPMEQNELNKFREYVKKRAQHVPIAYIIGEREFMGLPFKVTKDTLIPRPDTEILVENVLNNVDKDKEIEIVDVGDLFAPLNDNKFDVIVSNPPYIPQKDIATLEDDVKEYEPVSALTDGGDGLSYYRRLLSEGKAYIKENGFIALEIGIYQSNDVKQIAMDNGWKNIKIIKDYAGIDRVVLAWNVN